MSFRYGKRKPSVYRKTIKPFVRKHYPTMASAVNAGVKALQIATKVAGLINSEKKFFDDVYVPTTLLESTPIIRHLTGIPQGTDDEERVGNKIALKSMFSRYIVNWDDSSKDGMIRRIVIRSKSCLAGASPHLSEVLEASSTPIQRIYSPLKKTRAGLEFKVLSDEIVQQNSTRDKVMKEHYHVFKMQKDAQGNRTISPHVTYTGSSAGNYQEGTLWEMWIFYGTSAPTIGGYNRIRYMDN